MSERWPVTVAVTRPDGSVEHVQVGTAVRASDGFTLTLEHLVVRTDGARAAPSAPRSAARSPSPGQGSDMVFPPYGRSKGQPISGASLQDLEFYANGSRRSLADPGKARFHDKERVLLAAIEAEIARQRGEAPPQDDVPPPSDEDGPPF